MNLDEAWKITETLNNNANQESSGVWECDIEEAILYQSACFRKKFLELDINKQELICYWINKDNEFQDYFNSVSNNMSVDIFSKH